MKKVVLSIVLVFLMAFSVFANSNELWEQSTLNKVMKRGILRVGMEAGYMPFEIKNKQGKIIGFDVDIAKLMAKEMGVKLELVNTAWDGIIPALLTKKFDIIMSGMTITPQRNLQINFADPAVVVGQTILIRKELADEVDSYRDLNDPKYTIATKLGVTADFATKKYMPKAKLKLFETEPEAAMEVINGKADAFVYDLPYCAIFYAQHKKQLAFLDEPFTYEPLAWAVRKGDPDFINWLNNFLAQIKGDGRYDMIYKKWFESDAWLEQVQ